MIIKDASKITKKTPSPDASAVNRLALAVEGLRDSLAVQQPPTVNVTVDASGNRSSVVLS